MALMKMPCAVGGGEKEVDMFAHIRQNSTDNSFIVASDKTAWASDFGITCTGNVISFIATLSGNTRTITALKPCTLYIYSNVLQNSTAYPVSSTQTLATGESITLQPPTTNAYNAVYAVAN